MAPRKGKKAPRRKAPRRARVPRAPRMSVPDKGSISCKRTLANALTNQMYFLSNFQLADFPRAVNMARCFQHFRMTSIKLTWKPAYDTYSAATLQQKPRLYYMIDKSAGIPLTATLESLKQMGARPVELDEKPITRSWRPSVLQNVQTLVGQVSAHYNVSPWLITNSAPDQGVWNPSTVQHNGIVWYVEQGGVPNTTYYMEVEINFEFKKPLIDVAPAAAPGLVLPYATLDASPDGVEGGTDGITIPLASS